MTAVATRETLGYRHFELMELDAVHIASDKKTGRKGGHFKNLPVYRLMEDTIWFVANDDLRASHKIKKGAVLIVRRGESDITGYVVHYFDDIWDAIRAMLHTIAGQKERIDVLVKAAEEVGGLKELMDQVVHLVGEPFAFQGAASLIAQRFGAGYSRARVQIYQDLNEASDVAGKIVRGVEVYEEILSAITRKQMDRVRVLGDMIGHEEVRIVYLVAAMKLMTMTVDHVMTVAEAAHKDILGSDATEESRSTALKHLPAFVDQLDISPMCRPFTNVMHNCVRDFRLFLADPSDQSYLGLNIRACYGFRTVRVPSNELLEQTQELDDHVMITGERRDNWARECNDIAISVSARGLGFADVLDEGFDRPYVEEVRKGFIDLSRDLLSTEGLTVGQFKSRVKKLRAAA